MPNLSLKQKIIAIVTVIGLILIYIFQRGLYGSSPQALQVKNEGPQVVSTKPSPLDQTVLLPSQPVEITFNYPLQNTGEFKNRIEPKIDYKVELSSDRKTAKIIFLKPMDLGQGYTLFVLPDTKFDGAGNLGQDLVFHFKTISYKGI